MYNCTTIQGATFNMCCQMYRGHANTTALFSSPVVSALGSELDDLGSSPGQGKALCLWDVRGKRKSKLRFLGLAKSIYYWFPFHPLLIYILQLEVTLLPTCSSLCASVHVLGVWTGVQSLWFSHWSKSKWVLHCCLEAFMKLWKFSAQCYGKNTESLTCV